MVGEWQGKETMHPTPWAPDGAVRDAVIVNRFGPDGFAVIQDYRQFDGERSHPIAQHRLMHRMERQRRQYSREFKLEAVRLISERGVSFVQASRDLNVSARQIEAAVRIEVRDRGPGVPPARQHELFEPFAGSGASFGTIDSVGVGLSLVKLLAEAQGGSVGLASTPYVETIFWVTFPAHTPPTSAAASRFSAEDEIDPDTVFGDASIDGAGARDSAT